MSESCFSSACTRRKMSPCGSGDADVEAPTASDRRPRAPTAGRRSAQTPAPPSRDSATARRHSSCLLRAGMAGATAVPRCDSGAARPATVPRDGKSNSPCHLTLPCTVFSGRCCAFAQVIRDVFEIHSCFPGSRVSNGSVPRQGGEAPAGLLPVPPPARASAQGPPSRLSWLYITLKNRGWISTKWRSRWGHPVLSGPLRSRSPGDRNARTRRPGAPRGRGGEAGEGRRGRRGSEAP